MQHTINKTVQRRKNKKLARKSGKTVKHSTQTLQTFQTLQSIKPFKKWTDINIYILQHNKYAHYIWQNSTSAIFLKQFQQINTIDNVACRMWNVTWLVKLSRLSLRTDINNHNSFQESKVTKAASSQHSNDWCVWSISNTFLPLMQIFLITLHGMNLWTLLRQEGSISCLPWLEGAVNLPNLVWPKFMLKYLPGNAHKLTQRGTLQY